MLPETVALQAVAVQQNKQNRTQLLKCKGAKYVEKSKEQRCKKER